MSCLALYWSIVVSAQTYSVTNGTTPSGLAPGSPASSYALSKFESYSPFTGRLNLVIPLHHVGSRGTASYDMVLTPSAEPFSVVKSTSSPYHGLLGSGWTPWMPGYGPGTVFGREANETLVPCPTNGIITPEFTLSRLTFTRPDGSEVELVDTNTNGKPYRVPGYCTTGSSSWDAGRSTMFASRDGSSIVFVADSPIQDFFYNPGIPGSNVFQVTGYLRLRDGTTYRVVNSSVVWLQDRNGNQINFTYDSNNRVNQIVDQTNRTITVKYGLGTCKGTPASSCDTISYLGSNNSTQTVEIGTTDFNSILRSDYSGQPITSIFTELYSEGATGNNSYDGPARSYVRYPDGSQFNMLYNDVGEIARVVLPTGGAVEYDWGGAGGGNGWMGDPNGPGPCAIVRVVNVRREYSDGSNLSSKTYYQYVFPPRPDDISRQTTTEIVTNAAGIILSNTVHTYKGSQNDVLIGDGISYNDWREGQEVSTQYGSPSLETVSYTWTETAPSWCNQATGGPFSCSQSNGSGIPQNNPQLVEKTTTLNDTNQVSKIVYSYDSYNNKIDEWDYDWGQKVAGIFLRRIEQSYVTANKYISANEVSLLQSITIEDNSDQPIWSSHRSFSYDENDDASSTRGNVTTDDSWWSSNTPSGPQYQGEVVDSYTYDGAGNVLTHTDRNGNVTTYGYTDGLDWRPNVITLPTVNGIQQTTNVSYDPNTGNPIRITDPNGVVATLSYEDPLDRLTLMKKAVGTPDESWTQYNYTNATELDTYADQTGPTDGALHTMHLYDGFGRELEARQYETSTTFLATDTAYDALGRVLSKRNPYRVQGVNITDGGEYSTSYDYDALGRVLHEYSPDGAITTTTYSGNTATVTDPAGVFRTTTKDALGRLTQVQDSNQLTCYTYDLLDNLTGVSLDDCRNGPVRTFKYDSLSRLRSARNPENWTVSYTYDSAGNLKTKTDNRRVTTTYWYDELNRIQVKEYSDGTARVNYVYDAPGVANSIGRLTQANVSNGPTTYYTEYTALGQIASSNLQTAGQSYFFTYAYNLAGALTSEKYPSGNTVVTCYDGADRTKSVVLGSCENATANYVTGVNYWPHGAPHSYALGNDVSQFATYNSRLQMDRSWGALHDDGNKYLYYTALDWGGSNNNGNLRSAALWAGNAVPWGSLAGFYQSFNYDGINRLHDVTDSGGASRRFDYDQAGNMWVADNDPRLGLSPATPTSNVYNGNNHNINESYDASGNQTSFGGMFSLAYDAENRIISETSNTGGLSASYVYDADGRRVQKNTSDGGTTVYVYDALGQMAAEYSSQNSTAPCQTCYLTYDHLGSTRLVTDQNGLVVSRHDYLPFGEEIPGGPLRDPGLGFASADQVNQKFTGKERDDETGLDYFGARYYGSALGRFTSPDEFKGGFVDPFTGQDIETNTALPYADITNPQSLNKYAYVMNNPLRYTDPTGHCAQCLTELLESPAGQEATDWISNNLGQIAVGGAAIGAAAWAGAGNTLDKMAQSVAQNPTYAGPYVGPLNTPPSVQSGVTDASQPLQSGRSSNDVKPDPNAVGAHSVPKRDSNGKVTGYTTFDDKGRAEKRLDVKGAPHGGIPTPHVHEPKQGKGPGAPLRGVRSPWPDEVPK